MCLESNWPRLEVPSIMLEPSVQPQPKLVENDALKNLALKIGQRDQENLCQEISITPTL